MALTAAGNVVPVYPHSDYNIAANDYLIMALCVVMAALETAQETGKLVSWLKNEGDSVVKGEPLFEIETAKAVMEIESPGDGLLAGIKAQPGDEVPVGQTIAWIVRPGENPPTDGVAAASSRKKIATSAAPRSRSARRAASSAKPLETVKVSSRARRLAAQRGVNLADVQGSGADGEIFAADILAAIESKAAASPPEVSISSSIARLMAERTAQSWTTTPHFFVMREVDASALNEARKKLTAEMERSGQGKPTHSDLLVALVAGVLRKHSLMNASWSDGGIRENHDINIGLAMAVEDGVVAPVIRQAEKISVAEIAAQGRELNERARGGKLRPADIAGRTFTISNLGMFGAHAFTAIIVPPQAAILAVGTITDRVVPVDNHPGIRPMLTLTLASDHRVVDGARG